jgi:hypothetical protein
MIRFILGDMLVRFLRPALLAMLADDGRTSRYDNYGRECEVCGCYVSYASMKTVGELYEHKKDDWGYRPHFYCKIHAPPIYRFKRYLDGRVENEFDAPVDNSLDSFRDKIGAHII